MHLSNESLLVIILVGLIAGWLAGQVMRGSGFGLIGDLIVGLLGALIGDWLLPRQRFCRRNRVAVDPPSIWRGRLGIWALAQTVVNALETVALAACNEDAGRRWAAWA
jgi:uncharacterized membrane protein YeaQ/YmgE (transglycosylase-associated protein family)